MQYKADTAAWVHDAHTVQRHSQTHVHAIDRIVSLQTAMCALIDHLGTLGLNFEAILFLPFTLI